MKKEKKKEEDLFLQIAELVIESDMKILKHLAKI